MAASPPRGGPSSFRIRSLAVIVVDVCLFATLVLRLWYLQVADAGVPATRLASSESLKTICLPAPRGDIFSRGGALLAGKGRCPGAYVSINTVRYYPYGSALANIIGYVREITSTEAF